MDGVVGGGGVARGIGGARGGREAIPGGPPRDRSPAAGQGHPDLPVRGEGQLPRALGLGRRHDHRLRCREGARGEGRRRRAVRRRARADDEPQGGRDLRRGAPLHRQPANLRDHADGADPPRKARHRGPDRDQAARPGARERGAREAGARARLRRGELAGGERELPRAVPAAEHDHRVRGRRDPGRRRLRHPGHPDHDRAAEDARHRDPAERRVPPERTSCRRSSSRARSSPASARRSGAWEDTTW